MTTVKQDQDAFEDITAAAAADIQLVFDEGMARLTVITQCWEESSRECLILAPTSLPTSSAA
ncbi:hypothetical protein [Blastococcus saxobsidens]|nr:hypothetical protein [Blastococcus saxobsidens]